MDLSHVISGAVFFSSTGLVDGIITEVSGDKKLKGEVPDHIALIDPHRALPGADLTLPLKVFESTRSILGGGKNGPQVNLLFDDVAGYNPKSHIWVCEFTGECAAALNWLAAVSFMESKSGDRYNVPELPADLLHLGFGYSRTREVCSELFLDTTNAAGLDAFLWSRFRLKTPRPFGSNPQLVAELPVFKSCIQIYGPPAALRGLVTV